MITSKKNINKRIRLNKNQISDIVFCFLLKTTFVAYFIQIFLCVVFIVNINFKIKIKKKNLMEKMLCKTTHLGYLLRQNPPSLVQVTETDAPCNLKNTRTSSGHQLSGKRRLLRDMTSKERSDKELIKIIKYQIYSSAILESSRGDQEQHFSHEQNLDIGYVILVAL